eukprot:gene36285-31024_t
MIGAGAFFSGMCRLTVSLAVIMLELTNQLFFIPPMMLAMLISKWFADRYAPEALYHGLIHRLGMPLLDPDGDRSSALLNRNARHLMARPVVALRMDELRGCIRSALKTPHNGFPVVDGSSGVLRGFMLRSQLTRRRPKDAPPRDMSSSPFVVHKSFSARSTYRAFQSLGLRHLIYGALCDFVLNHRINAPLMDHECMRKAVAQFGMHIDACSVVVVDDHYCPVGIITRKDLASALHHGHEHDPRHGIIGDLRTVVGELGFAVGRAMSPHRDPYGYHTDLSGTKHTQNSPNSTVSTHPVHGAAHGLTSPSRHPLAVGGRTGGHREEGH